MPKVLLVEDNPVLRLLLPVQMGRFGITPDIAESGEQALEMMKLTLYDVVFMDVRMPGMSGMETSIRYRLYNRGSKTRIYALTASLSEDLKAECLQSGMDGFLDKPNDLDEMDDVLRLAGLSHKRLIGWGPVDKLLFDPVRHRENLV